MSAVARLKDALKRTPAVYPWIWYRNRFAPARSQSDEAAILERLVARYPVPRLFIEFGFGAWEYNCASLASTFHGLLLDGDQTNVSYATKALPAQVRCEHAWLTLETIGIIERFAEGREVGILSVDVDGNDFWFLRSLIGIRPAIVVCEFNRAFGLRPLTVPYDPVFERFEKHASGLYFGASIAALHHLCTQHGYALVAVSRNGINAFFVRRDLLLPDDDDFDMTDLFHDASNPGQADRFDEIANLDFVDVTGLGR
jgi:hypothetical protein